MLSPEGLEANQDYSITHTPTQELSLVDGKLTHIAAKEVRFFAMLRSKFA